MTEQEAIGKLNMLDEALNFQRYDADECSLALNMAINALEKQIPKRWEYEQSDECDVFICPVCNERFLLDWGTPKDNDYNYCPNCGQALRWK